jgi:capsule biosynthesis phosphatase
VTDSPNTLYVDLDGTLCPIKAEGDRYEDLPAYQDVIERLFKARNEGFRIVVHTARNMRTFGGDMARINVETGPSVLRWLDRNNVPYDGLVLGKPWPGPKGFYVDDRTVRPSEFTALDTDEIAELLAPRPGRRRT